VKRLGPRYDSLGRPYFTWVCDQGHWHRGQVQALKCNRKHRSTPQAG
jgi:hypothetical protein